MMIIFIHFWKGQLFVQYCCDDYGSALWALSSGGLDLLCVDWSKILRNLITYCNIISTMAEQPWFYAEGFLC